MTYYSLGRWIVEEEQGGDKRASYGKQIIKKLSERLMSEYGRGFSEDTIENARKFYLFYEDRISETLFSELQKEKMFSLNWSHYLQLMRIKKLLQAKLQEWISEAEEEA